MYKITNQTVAKMRQTLVGRDYNLWTEISPKINASLSVAEYLIVYLDYSEGKLEIFSFVKADDCYDEFQELCNSAEKISYEDKTVTVRFPYGKECENCPDEICYDFGTGMQLKDAASGEKIVTAFMYNPDYYED